MAKVAIMTSWSRNTRGLAVLDLDNYGDGAMNESLASIDKRDTLRAFPETSPVLSCATTTNPNAVVLPRGGALMGTSSTHIQARAVGTGASTRRRSRSSPASNSTSLQLLLELQLRCWTRRSRCNSAYAQRGPSRLPPESLSGSGSVSGSFSGFNSGVGSASGSTSSAVTPSDSGSRSGSPRGAAHPPNLPTSTWTHSPRCQCGPRG